MKTSYRLEKWKLVDDARESLKEHDESGLCHVKIIPDQATGLSKFWKRSDSI